MLFGYESKKTDQGAEDGNKQLLEGENERLLSVESSTEKMEQNAAGINTNTAMECLITSPLEGTVIPLHEVEDVVFPRSRWAKA